MFSVIRNAAQPFRAPDPGKPEASQPLWQTVSDPTNKWYVFASTTCPNVVWVELDQSTSPNTPQLKLDLVDELAIQHGIAATSRQVRRQGELQLPHHGHGEAAA
jgi:choloylglycine hydrolase